MQGPSACANARSEVTPAEAGPCCMYSNCQRQPMRDNCRRTPLQLCIWSTQRTGLLDHPLSTSPWRQPSATSCQAPFQGEKPSVSDTIRLTRSDTPDRRVRTVLRLVVCTAYSGVRRRDCGRFRWDCGKAVAKFCKITWAKVWSSGVQILWGGVETT